MRERKNFLLFATVSLLCRQYLDALVLTSLFAPDIVSECSLNIISFQCKCCTFL
nr:MAG TPA: hypothetical protein [Caudoviricetes sp.]DAW85049.1 MAG TPA: hypothetical protein [Bacteriophage sp.]